MAGFFEELLGGAAPQQSEERKSAKNSIAGSGKCPYCANILSYNAGETSVTCFCCDQTVAIGELEKVGGASSTQGGAQTGASFNVASVAMTIDSPESGLVYVENFFANYDWEAYKLSSILEIEEVDGMVEKNKIKNGANSSAWILDFESKSVPLAKKLEGLSELSDKVASVYDPVDSARALEYYDVYARIIRNLIAVRDSVVAQLANDINYAKKFGADSDTLESMSSRLEQIKAKLSVLAVPAKFEKSDIVLKAKEQLNEKIASALARDGIDAKSVYKSAVTLYETDMKASLPLFESIKGYADSAERVAKINKYFNFCDELATIFGKHYIIEKQEYFNPNRYNEGMTADEIQELENELNEGNMAPMALYEIVDGKKAETPLVSEITSVLGGSCYAGKIYYISARKNICCFDVNTKEETILDQGRVGSYEVDGFDTNTTYDKYYTKNTRRKNNFFTADSNRGFFLRKKLEIALEEPGCFQQIVRSIKEWFGNIVAMITKKKKAESPIRKDNYKMIYVDMTTNTVKTIVDQLIDVTEYYDNQLFYIKANEDPNSKTEKFMVCDVVSGVSEQVLDDNCEIHDVVKGKVVYSLWEPNDFNRDLYAMDLKTGASTLIEKNIYYYFTSVEDRVFYTVGNNTYNPLFSNNLNGTDRLEIMQNVDNIFAIRGGWMYISKGTGYNRALVKMSTDGKRVIFLCSQVKEIVTVTDSYVYYIDSARNFRVVRNDGKDNRVIANGMYANNIIVGNDAIFYLRSEVVYARYNYKNEIISGSERYSKSLYKMDFSGHNVRKLMFNVDKFKDYDEETLYLMKKENVLYEITTPIDDKENIVEYSRYPITKFMTFNKKTEEFRVILTLGEPQVTEKTYKPGCFKKEVTLKSSYREIIDKSGFKNTGLTPAGAVYQKDPNRPVEKK